MRSALRAVTLQIYITASFPYVNFFEIATQQRVCCRYTQFIDAMMETELGARIVGGW
jgi:hypothetical protein